jgi:tetratricopeptide (TPR) repeat protein
VTADPPWAAALADFGLILHKLDRHEEALATFDKVLAIEPQNPAALSNRGNTLAKLGRQQEALASYDRALGSGPIMPKRCTIAARCSLCLSDSRRRLQVMNEP